MEILFLYLWLELVPAFDPCNTGTPNTCYAIAGRAEYTAQRIERFKSKPEVMEWIKKNGKDGRIIDVQTGREEYIYTKPVIKKVEKVVIVEEIVGYEIKEMPDFINGLTFHGSIHTIPDTYTYTYK